MKLLKKLANKPVIGKVIQRFIQKKADNEVMAITQHFSQYLSPLLAASTEQRDACHMIRHQVYCAELNYEELKPDNKECDEFDLHSIFCLIQHSKTGDFAGTVRLVRPQSEGDLLPIEKYCVHALSGASKHPANYPREHICEISRLAVPEKFRRRKTDQYRGAATGVINETTYSESELRCFPFIAIGLYLSAAALCIELGIQHVFVMMEPRLARSMRFVGIEFEQLGPTVEYHGQRAPYYIDPLSVRKTLTPGFLQLLNNVEAALAPQIKAALKNNLVVRNS